MPSSTTPLLIEGLEAGALETRTPSHRSAPPPSTKAPASVKITAEFAEERCVSETDFPPKGMSAIALVGRSNVGKSSSINALVRCRWWLARARHLARRAWRTSIVSSAARCRRWTSSTCPSAWYARGVHERVRTN